MEWKCGKWFISSKENSDPVDDNLSNGSKRRQDLSDSQDVPSRTLRKHKEGNVHGASKQDKNVSSITKITPDSLTTPTAKGDQFSDIRSQEKKIDSTRSETEASSGKRKRGRPAKRLIQTVRTPLKWKAQNGIVVTDSLSTHESVQVRIAEEGVEMESSLPNKENKLAGLDPQTKGSTADDDTQFSTPNIGQSSENLEMNAAALPVKDKIEKQITKSGGEQTCNSNDEISQSLPFVKNTSIWTTIESMDVFKQMPQKPHFRPLEQQTETLREGLAIGYMVNFSNVVRIAFGLQFRDPISMVDDISVTLDELETHGFDVRLVRERVVGFVEARDKQGKLFDEVNELDSQILVHIHKKCGIEKEISELQDKLSLAQSAMQNEDDEIARLQANLLEAKQSIENVEHEFISSGWCI